VFKAIKSLFVTKRSESPDVESLIHAYGAVIGDGKLGPRDISELPASKEVLSAALIAAIHITPDGPIREHLRSGYMVLGEFQNMDECARRGVNVNDLAMAEMEKRLKDV
jgi:hypothetical protein